MSFQTINPATGETLRTFPMASDAEVATVLKTADDRYNNERTASPYALPMSGTTTAATGSAATATRTGNSTSMD
jgi:hypothetical protein